MGKKARLHAFISRPPACLNQFAEETLDSKKVEEEAKSIQSRLREILTQLWDENAIFQRVMYKNQNQHRRTVYFRRLLQVRRDLLLLQSFGLQDVVETLSHCVSFSKHKTLPPKAVLGSLGQGLQSKDHLISIVQRRLLGAARLLQLIADPILNASLLIEGLLSQSFFMPFALTVLALLARLRALLVQALYEIIAAFNLVSAFMLKMEIASAWSDVPLLLECSWNGVKLVFLEKARPPLPPHVLIPLPSSLSDAEKLPDVGWFIDDRSTSLKEKLQSTGVLEPVLYEREESFILEDSPFEFEAGVPMEETPTLITSMEANVSSDTTQNSSTGMAGLPVEAVSTPSSGFSSGNRKLAQDVRAELESWKSELESWGSKKDQVVEVDKSTKKRVAYVSVQVKEPKSLKTGHPL